MPILDKIKPRTMIILLSALSLFARLLFLARKSFWIDECLAWGATQMGWGEMCRAVATGTPHPPVAFLLMKLSTLLAGNSEFGIRLLVALLVASAVIPVYRLSSRFTSVRGGFWAAILWVLSPFAVSLGQEAWVYGINIAISFWFIDLADMAWRGSSKAYWGSIIIGILGLLTQHIFLLGIAVSAVLYFSVEPASRVSFKKFILVPILLALFYLPVFLSFSEQFAARNTRMASAGVLFGFDRLFSTLTLSQLMKIIPGGILPDFSANLLDRPRMLIAYIINAVAVLSLALGPFFAGMLSKRIRKYLWICFLLPLGLFLTDSPSIRQLAILWVPFAITSAALFKKFRFAGPAVALLCLAALIPYYKLEVFPYHRSDWRDAVETVEASAVPEDLVIVLGGKSTSLAWEFYSTSNLRCLTPAGNFPFAGEGVDENGNRIRNYVDPVFLLDSIYCAGQEERIWIIMDKWNASSIWAINTSYRLVYNMDMGADMEMALLEFQEIR